MTGQLVDLLSRSCTHVIMTSHLLHEMTGVNHQLRGGALPIMQSSGRATSLRTNMRHFWLLTKSGSCAGMSMGKQASFSCPSLEQPSSPHTTSTSSSSPPVTPTMTSLTHDTMTSPVSGEHEKRMDALNTQVKYTYIQHIYS